MKKVIKVLFVLLLITGCAVEDSPESYFSIALNEIEEAETYQTHLVLKQDNTVLLEMDYTKNDDVSEDTKALMQFEYSMIFSDFLKEEDVIVCTILPENSPVLVNLVKNYTDEPLETITHHMYLKDGFLDYVVMELNTTTQTYECTISVK